jgi:hypothetical protein
MGKTYPTEAQKYKNHNWVIDFTNELVSGVDVIITIFYDFCQFSAKKMAFFSKSNVCSDQIFAKISCSLSKKTPIFSAKIFKKSKHRSLVLCISRGVLTYSRTLRKN